MENPGIDPGTSRMQSGRSTIWANPPATRYSVQYGLFISHVKLLIILPYLKNDLFYFLINLTERFLSL